MPLGSRVLVKSGLHLGVTATPSTTTVVEQLVGELGRWQGVGTVVLAGDLFASAEAASRADEVLAAHPQLLAGIASFLETPERSVFVVPGEHDRDLSSAEQRSVLEAAGATVVDSLILECTTATGTRTVLVTSTCGTEDEPPTSSGEEHRPWLVGIDQLESPQAARRFVSSRVLYRRLRNYVWIPPVVAIVVAVATHFAFVQSRLEHLGRAKTHRVIDRLVEAPWHLRFLWVAIAIIVAEVIIGVITTIIARRAFRSTSAAQVASTPRGEVTDDVSVTPQNAEQVSLDLARSFVASGGTGVILGGPMASTLTHLDAGFLAIPGASAIIVREHRGRLGLPPVFLDHSQMSQIMLETGAELHVRLELFDHLIASPKNLERLVAGETVAPTPAREVGMRMVAAWPTGGTWPPPPDFSSTQQRARRIRRVAAVSLFITGLFDVLSAVSPPLRNRLHTVLNYLPLGVSQTAATAVAIIGIALIMLSRGILRGQRRSWVIAVILLAVSTALHIAHAAAVGAVVVTAAVLVLFVVERRWFQGTTDRDSLTSVLPTLALILVVAVTASFIGIELSNLHTGALPAWPLVLVAVIERLVGLSTVALPDRLEDFVYPTMLAVGIAVAVTILYLLTRPVVDRRLSDQSHARERRIAQVRARDIVTRHGKGTLDYFALRDDKQYFFYGDSLVAYAVYGGICLVSPDPIGPETERTQVWGAFRSFCDAHGWSPSVIGAGTEWLPIYDDSGMRWLYLGDEAVVDVQSFSLEGKKMKGLRQACTRLERNGYTIEFLDPSAIDPARVPQLAELMGMNRRGDDERGFSMMLGRLFDPKDTGLLLTVVSGPDGLPAAMCQFVPSHAINGYSLDLMRRDPGDHPNGLLDYALCSTIMDLKTRGVSGLSLNFSAFRSTLDGEKGDGITQRVERWGLKRLSAILPIETLWRFNEKYQPTWLARHLVYASPEVFVPTVAAALRAESITEIPVVGRFLAQDPSNRPGTVVPPDLLEGRAAEPVDESR
jgi:lysylphosphatidylglycerol synthetase-like protein (DUF2156 family)